MIRAFNKLPTGWKRLILLGYIAYSIWVFQSFRDGQFLLEKLFIFGMASLFFWAAILLAAWVIDGFKH